VTARPTVRRNCKNTTLFISTFYICRKNMAKPNILKHIAARMPGIK
jgi:hypothetical protein